MQFVQFYFLRDEYFLRFPDRGLMGNKENNDGLKHDRPCFFAFQDNLNKEILWLIPISTKIEKYQKIYDDITNRNGKCSKIRIGEVFGRKQAFLIQNMCPAIMKYVYPYLDKNNNPLGINNKLSKEVIFYANKVLKDYKHNKSLIYPDIEKIYNELLDELDLDIIKKYEENKDNIETRPIEELFKELGLDD